MAIHKIAFDPSTKMGWCLLMDDSDKPEHEQRPAGQRLVYGTWDLTRDNSGKKRTTRGNYYLMFLEQFIQLRKKYGLETDSFKIYLEMEAISANRNEGSAKLAGGWLATLELLCERKGWGQPFDVPIASWRKAFIGRSVAPKEVVGTDMRRAWIKDAVLKECAERGLTTDDDNAADAIGILFWAMNDGQAVRDAAKEQRKQKQKEKRAQKKLL